MRVSVFGLGYVGSVSAAAFAADGHEVVGVDVNADKVAAINEGRSPIVEPGLGELLQQGVRDGQAARDDEHRGRGSTRRDLSLVCVGTPSRRNGSLDLTYLIRVCEEIGDGASRQAVVSRRRHSQHRAPGNDARARHSGARADVRQEIRRRVRRVGQPRVPARRHRAEGLPRAAADAGRAQPRRRRRADQGALPGHRGAALRHQHPQRRDGQVHEQRLACGEGGLRQRDRQPVQARRRRQPRGDGHLLHRTTS